MIFPMRAEMDAHVVDVETGITNELFFVSTTAPNVEELRQRLGVGDIR